MGNSSSRKIFFIIKLVCEYNENRGKQGTDEYRTDEQGIMKKTMEKGLLN